MADSEPHQLLLLCVSKLTAHSIQRLLRDHESLIAVDAEAAWELLVEPNSIHLLISDLSLLDDEFGLLERLRAAQDPLLKGLPVLALVGAEDEAEQQRVVDLGTSDFVSKPFSSIQLNNRINQYLQQFDQMREDQLLNIGSSFHQDNLTGLLQKEGLLKRIEQEQALALRHHTPFGLVALQLMAYAQMQQQYNPRVADVVMKQIAHLLDNTIRREDVLAYQGQGVFMLMYPATNALGSMTALRRLQQRLLQRTVRVKGVEVDMHFSAALVAPLDQNIDAEDLLTELLRLLQKALDKGPGEILA